MRLGGCGRLVHCDVAETSTEAVTKGLTKQGDEGVGESKKEGQQTV